MGREEYKSCMSKNMGGGRLKGLSKEDRRIEFCTIAKECSKGISYEEARPICIEAAANPKPPKPPKTKKFCITDINAVMACTTAKIDVGKLTPENMAQVFGEAFKSCSGAKKGALKSAQKIVQPMDPQQKEALATIGILSEQFKEKTW